ncbi:MAG: YajQ family cyclic di-GMP-binding protein [Pseudonocardiaceae bacterium]
MTSKVGIRLEREVDAMADPSFDVVSKVDRQEADNALNQAAKELSTRFDFRGTGAKVTWASEEAMTIEAETEQRCRAAVDVVQSKLVKRGISLKAFEVDEPAVSGKVYRTTGRILQGISQDKAKEIAKAVREEKLKGVQAQVQGDQLRISGKKKDDLQAVIALLKGRDFGVALQFINFR